jgi:Ni/Co efflux regulator RcnB
MRTAYGQAGRLVAIALCGALIAGPAFAQGRGHEVQERGHGPQMQDRDHGPQARDRDHDRNQDRDRARVQVRFDDHQREMAHRYYSEWHGGRCPPGLARKGNRCQPPGHAKRWRIGHPLPRDVIFYDVPRTLVVQLGPPPRGYRYARVANDILLLALGTGLVVDALQDLGRQ